MSEQERIRGKVAQIMNAREVALNIGSDQGVEMGMLFDVLNPKGEQIRDPETKKVLGSLELPKKRLKIVQVQPKLSLARTYRKWLVTKGGVLGPANWEALFGPQRTMTRYDTLRLKGAGEEEGTFEDINESESIVRVGDPVVQVISKEKESD